MVGKTSAEADSFAALRNDNRKGKCKSRLPAEMTKLDKGEYGDSGPSGQNDASEVGDILKR